jgi:pimeloyl-ACP methyl ester carboxylesterase
MTLSTYTFGSGSETVVFLHGFCETKEIWKDFTSGLEHDLRGICYDLPGFGESELLQHTTIQSVAKTIKEDLEKKGEKNVRLIGHSLGGYVALSLAKQFPELVQNVMLFHSSVFSDTEEKKTNRNKTIDFVKKNGVEAFAKTFAPSLFAKPDQQNQKVALLFDMARQTPAATHIAYSEAMRDREDFADWVSETDIPFLFIVGKEDGAVPLEKSKEQIILPKKAKSLVLEGVGHMGILEAPELCQEFIRKNIA